MLRGCCRQCSLSMSGPGRRTPPLPILHGFILIRALPIHLVEVGPCSVSKIPTVLTSTTLPTMIIEEISDYCDAKSSSGMGQLRRRPHVIRRSIVRRRTSPAAVRWFGSGKLLRQNRPGRLTQRQGGCALLPASKATGGFTVSKSLQVPANWR